MPSRTVIPEPPAAAGSPELPGPRLVNVPDGWPPYDGDVNGAACPAVSGAAPGEPAGGRQAPGLGGPAASAAGRAAAGAALARAAPAGPAAAGPAAQGPAPGGPAAAWPRQFAQAVVEILAGARPLRQIVPMTTDRVRAKIEVLALRLVRGGRPRIQSVRTSQPAASVVEITVVIGSGSRSRALAMRLEHMPARSATPGLPGRPARWLCTELEAD